MAKHAYSGTTLDDNYNEKSGGYRFESLHYFGEEEETKDKVFKVVYDNQHQFADSDKHHTLSILTNNGWQEIANGKDLRGMAETKEFNISSHAHDSYEVQHSAALLFDYLCDIFIDLLYKE